MTRSIRSHTNLTLVGFTPRGKNINGEAQCSLHGVVGVILVQVSFFIDISRFPHNVSSGIKIAKLEIKMILALFLSRYEYKLVNASGKPQTQIPSPNRNDIHRVSYFLRSFAVHVST